MKERLEHYRGGVAWVANGIGPRINFAPPGEGDGNGGKTEDDSGEDLGGSEDRGGDDAGADGDSGKGSDDTSRAGKLGGLFGKRTKAEEGKKDEGGDPPADGRPEGLADKFWDPKTKQVNADALAKAYTDLEKAHGTLRRTKTIGGEVPEDEAEYFGEGVKLPDTVDRLSVTPDDPGLKAFASICKKEGIGKDLAGRILTQMFVKMNDFAPAPIDPDEEMKALGKTGPAMVDGLFTWVSGMEKAGDLSEDDAIVVEQIMMTAKGARFLAKMRNMTGQEPIPINPGTGVRGMSQDQWNEEYKEAVKTQNYKRQAELDEMGELINGTDPAFSSRQGGVNPEKRVAR